MKTIAFRAGATVPALGQGTWKVGDRRAARDAEIATLRRGLSLGLTVIDTAEMYGVGASEELVGTVIQDCRDDVFLVSKVYPHNAGRRAMATSCEASLKRLGTDRLDLYLLHWRGGVPLAETVDGFERLAAAGKIGQWGVSNFDVDDMIDLFAAGGTACAANQVLYNVTRRGPEHTLIPWLDERQIPVMAYSPVEQGRLPSSGALKRIADRHDASVMQVALAFAMRLDNVMAIPKASTVAHVEDNRGAMDFVLNSDDLAEIDAAFPPPRRKTPLDML
ncbi:aldo/keto reductase [Lichenihabitans sp. PAMC28606]|uniref:aldo/keto reductase n=1 Tax=Lichenihabitans sp. PAMC28606 TaxID=2880932 RepID=UPI001D0A0317|nr:aldo/keto reductase [Lichenihabitans sp. PAMC28606]UDL94773.1 aldo/keto reductase [Lichenihabitans sp. PAMC28606]